MHKSKLGGFIIDCQTNDLDGAAHFWGAALGMPVHELPGSEGYKFVRGTGHTVVRVATIPSLSVVCSSQKL